MKNILKRLQILLLALFMILGSVPGPVIAKEQFNNGITIHSIQDYQQRGAVNTANLPSNTEKSGNWAGYISVPMSKGSSYTSISGSWTVPGISSSRQSASAAQWIGLGGVNSEDLLQIGTIEEIKNGQPTAEVFWEKLPYAAQNILSIPMGSVINVSISKVSDSTWNLTFTAAEPDGKVETKTISTELDSSYEQGIGTSAEWISEDPSNQYNQLLPLANTDTVKYQSAKVNENSLKNSSNNVHPVAMISGSGNIAIYPSEIGTDGESFTTTTNSSYNNNAQNFRRRSIDFPRQKFLVK